MRVLLLGGGAREHALAVALTRSPLVSAVWAMPGNPGIAEVATCVAGDATDVGHVVRTAQHLKIELVVVGPEAPLVAGVADGLRAASIEVFGPSQAAARIEGSKAFAKEVMHAAGVPTARFEVFVDLEAAAARAEAWGPVVVKADGLAAGKGVVVADTGAEAAAAVRALATLPAGKTLLLEERLSGPEVSVIALCDGERFVLLPTAQDHKRLRDGDEGPNTGGMGAFCPSPLLSAAQLDAIGRTIFMPTLAELSRRGMPFRGALFAGLMLTPTGPMVLEFNCRLGDPETQVMLTMLRDDVVPALVGCAKGALRISSLAVHDGAAVGVVLAAAGYPDAPRAGDVIVGLTTPRADSLVFHAGTKLRDGVHTTSGGRVLTVCARGDDVGQARLRAYAAADAIVFEGKQLRRDIGGKRSA